MLSSSPISITPSYASRCSDSRPAISFHSTKSWKGTPANSQSLAIALVMHFRKQFRGRPCIAHAGPAHLPSKSCQGLAPGEARSRSRESYAQGGSPAEHGLRTRPATCSTPLHMPHSTACQTQILAGKSQPSGYFIVCIKETHCSLC